MLASVCNFVLQVTPAKKAALVHTWLRSADTTLWAQDELIRAEQFGPDRLEQHARTLADAQPIGGRPLGAHVLARRRRSNEAVLLRSYRAIARAVEGGQTITLAAEWILDNFHIVEEQILEIKGDLPPGYYRQLPRIASGHFAGLPRVFGIAWAYVAHMDSRFDADTLCRMLTAYQSVDALTIGELWAVAITLRIILVENLRRAAERILKSHRLRLKANAIADRVLGLDGEPPVALSTLLADEKRPLPRTLVVHLAHRLRDPGPLVASSVQWLESQATRHETSMERLVVAEHRRQASMNVTVRNIITSMRQISAIDWSVIFERVSLVDQMLRDGSAFAEMDFQTRDTYRRRIENIARYSTLDELAVTRLILDLARKADDPTGRRKDPGYYLIGKGVETVERAAQFRASSGDRLRTFLMRMGAGGYLGLLAIATAMVIGAMIVLLARLGMSWALPLFALLGLIPASELAGGILNRILAFSYTPSALPSLDYQNGVPGDGRTLVVIPALLTNRDAVEGLIELLEVHYLGNASGEITFAILSDWADSPSEHAPGDEELLAAARDGIARLNQRHPRREEKRFLLFHRRRAWNPAQSAWMGWERKRGKLQELNRYLRGDTGTSFIPIDDAAPVLPQDIHYVVTLDADTRMPRDTVSRLVGKMVHPLNRPQFDPVEQRVVEGYGIIQPRVTMALPMKAGNSWFQKVFSGSAGMDPYAAPVSDLYQDLFEEGSFVGKGIYDVDAVQASMEGRTPENAILSHDLFEGIFARAGLASDIEVVEEFPRRYDVAVSRMHRWARGDWQLLPWITATGGASSGAPAAPLLGRWKMLDNLRRTLVAPVTVMALLAGWFLSPVAALAWTLFITATIAVPPVVSALIGFNWRSAETSWRRRLGELRTNIWLGVLQSGFVIATLVHQASQMVDAIMRTLWRLAVSRKLLLEWVTADQASRAPEMTLGNFYRWMAVSVAVAAAAAIVAFAASPLTGLVAMPFVIAWAAAPALVFSASKPRPDQRVVALTEADAEGLRLIARRTWRFFERFVTPAENMLPPDNYQEPPQPAVAHRTSPTNMGLYLLTIVAARDFGWLGLADMVGRLEATLGTMNRLHRFRGHFYNWYETTDLRPLDPQYVSTVDSGNLAGHLIALANACDEAITEPLLKKNVLRGIADHIRLLRQGAVADAPTGSADVLDQIAAAIDRHGGGPITLAELSTLFAIIEPMALRLVDICRVKSTDPTVDDESLIWAEALAATITSHQRDAALVGGNGTLAGRLSLAEGGIRRRLEPVARARSEVVGTVPPSAPGFSADAEAFALVGRLMELAALCRTMAMSMDFRFLYDGERQLLSIGYLPQDGQLDPNCYDLLASEARLASFFAIAKGDIPTKHWFRLGRSTTSVNGGAALISWSGSMFEYLMPSLVMRAPDDSLLARTNRLVVERQIDYGERLGIPWGISESAYNARNLEFTYQYSNFGVPGLGLKRGLGANTVIAPYATGLAAMVDPSAAVKNYEALADVGALGAFGYYEALDYTPGRVPTGEKVAIVRNYMAHHQGMTIVAIADALLGGEMRRRFHAEPIIAGAELLLQERHPREASAIEVRAQEVKAAVEVRNFAPQAPRLATTPHTASPQIQILSNAHYSVMITNSGSGYSRWNNVDVTRWREDRTLDDWGTYVYLRDAEASRVWSAAYQPTRSEAESYTVDFSEHRVEFVRRDRTITTTMEVIVSAEDDAEVRRVSLRNMGGMRRDIEVTSYAEIVLGSGAADLAHPAFSKMFVQTEYVAEHDVILAHRRKRAPGDPDLWAAHFAVVDGVPSGATEYETDRAKFIGVGRDLAAPESIEKPLSNTVGTVLDPIFSIRRRVRIDQGRTTRVLFWTLVGSSREEVLERVQNHKDPLAFERAAMLAWTNAQVQLRHIDLLPDQAALFQTLAESILFSEPGLRPPDVSAAIQSALWSQGISGDLPIVLVRIDDPTDIELARELILAHEYFRLKRLAVDIVILNERATSYVQDLQDALRIAAGASHTRGRLPQFGGAGEVFILRGDIVREETRNALLAVARAVLVGRRGSLAEQLKRLAAVRGVPGRRGLAPPPSYRSPPADVGELRFFNGYGGFNPAGDEYVTVLANGQSTPAPWINVVANPNFGFHAATDGAGYTWSLNSRENQLTPWSNDPVVNRTGEAFYIRDEETGALWSPTAQPIRARGGIYVARHGFGYSRFTHSTGDIETDLTQFVPSEDPVKVSRLTIRNVSDRPRRMTVVFYCEWVLGPSRSAGLPFITTELSRDTGAMLARNPWNRDYGTRVAFLDLGGRQESWTGDREEFLGRLGGIAHPAALATGARLSNTVGQCLDPCGAMSVAIRLRPNESTDIVVLLGEADSNEAAEILVSNYREADIDRTLRGIKQEWRNRLGLVQVTTPDPAMDVMLNGWLLYQSIACRMWGRSGFYQASGAFGFRDQLQDSLSVLLVQPELARGHILKAASRQFEEGDVQHWWLPASGQGVRTRISDDTAWLAYVTAAYVETTGDASILDEMVPFLDGPRLAEGEHDSFFQPRVIDRRASLFDHCALGIERNLAIGSHGLPLMGTGDWNDGMNLVGAGGKGESVWLGWFLHAALEGLAPLAERRGRADLASRWRSHCAALREALESSGWDGEWYRRAYFDDGTPLGTSAAQECRIDSIAQSWSVISGAGELAHSAAAMAAVERNLMRPDDRLALLFTPPFDVSPLEPGYIKGYPPGLRENGGQYTHAAIWMVIAYTLSGEGEKAARLFAMLNPINHAAPKHEADRYKVEPYAVAADIYSAPGHVGRGGWTWYTGSAGWFYRSGVEWILGLKKRGAAIEIDPCIPPSWPGYRIALRHGSSTFSIDVRNPDGVSRGVRSIEMDGTSLAVTPPRFTPVDDGRDHEVVVTLGRWNLRP